MSPERLWLSLGRDGMGMIGEKLFGYFFFVFFVGHCIGDDMVASREPEGGGCDGSR